MLDNNAQAGEHEDILQLLPLHAMGTLDDDDDAHVTAHLAACAACRRSLQIERETIALLAYSAPQLRPSATLQSRVLARIAQEPVPVARHRRSGSRVMSPLQRGAFLAAAILPWMLIIGLGAVLATGNHAPSQPRVTVVALQRAGEDYGRVTIVAEARQGSLMVTNMPPLPARDIYTVWLVQHHNAPEMVGTFHLIRRTDDGVAAFTGARALNHYARLVITREQGAPGDRPHGPVMASAQLDHAG